MTQLKGIRRGSTSLNLDEYDKYIQDFEQFKSETRGLINGLQPTSYSRNCLFRGSNITSSSGNGLDASVYTAIQSGDFSNIYLGDYWKQKIVGLDGTEAEYTCRIAHIDYDNDYVTNVSQHFAQNPPKHALSIVCDESFGVATMQKDDDTKNPYVTSQLRTTTLKTLGTNLYNVFKDHLYATSQMFPNALSSDGSQYTGGANYESYCDLMSVEQVFGSSVPVPTMKVDSDHPYPYSPGYQTTQLQLFRIAPQYAKGNYWLSTMAPGKLHYAVVSPSKIKAIGGTSDSIEVRPRFVIG